MGKFILGRLLQSLFALALLSALIFGLSRAIGDPLDTMLPADAPPEAEERLREALGLDLPVHEQYVTYMGNLVTGDFGSSIRGGQDVSDLLASRLPNSLMLAGVSMVMVVAIAFPLGIIAASARGRAPDTIARVVSLMGQSVPAFWVGILLIQLFAVQLGWLPSSGMGTPLHFILPAFTMGLFVIAGMGRLLRTGMLEVLDSEFVRFARSKGVSERSIVWKHALRNALVQVMTFGGVYFSILVTMAIVQEVVFAWPGIGRLAYSAIIERDYTVMQGVVIVTGVIVVAVNFVVDTLYAVVDPRIRVGKG